jgi:hypothetical protein
MMGTLPMAAGGQRSEPGRGDVTATLRRRVGSRAEPDSDHDARGPPAGRRGSGKLQVTDRWKQRGSLRLTRRSGQVRSGQVRYITRTKSETMRVTRQLGLPPRYRPSATGLNLATPSLELIDVIQHSLPNDELCQCNDTSDSESVPKNGQVQLRAHARAAFAS